MFWRRDRPTEKVKDPVCEMQIAPAQAAATREHGGRTYHFCSRSCVDKFDAAPDSFVGEEPATEARPS
jgi:Cu+-exporting ATPase